MKDAILLLLRLAGAVLFFQAGFDKIQDPSTLAGTVGSLGFPSFIPAIVLAWGCALAESVCALLVVVGFKARLNSAVLAFNFAVAAYAHTQLWGDSLLKILTIDLLSYRVPAGIYLIVFGILMVTGAGSFSIDGQVGGSDDAGKKKSN